MASSRWTQEQLNSFYSAAQSLKLYRRAELEDEEGKGSLIEELYVDPLPNQHIFKTVLKPNTTFIIGRKGTGKSTIFQRVQHELGKKPNYASAYLEIKTIYESSQVDPQLYAKVDLISSSLPRESFEKLLLYKSFLKEVINEIKDEIEKRLEASKWERIKEKFSGTKQELFEGLNNLLEEADVEKFISVVGVKQLEVQAREAFSGKSGNEAGIEVGLSSGPEVKGTLSATDSNELSRGEERKYADILLRVFNIKEIVIRLKELLWNINKKHLYVFIDDFSELPEEAMRIVVDTILTPLNNWSEELIKFKIAAYPGRIYYGGIDKTKIDEIYLDIYKLYGTTDVTTMEEKAIDFTRRLVERRLEHYCECGPGLFFEPNEDLWRQFFYATQGNPRNLGYILYYLHESNLIYNEPIKVRSIRDSARKYFEDKIEPYFSMNKFLHESFSERSSIFGLKELLESIVKRARELRSYRGSDVTRDIGRIPTSHFHVLVNLESLLSTLELNFFLTKYWEMSDRDGRKVAIFALNYGLCQKYAIEFGRPRGRTEYRKYFIERIFDYTPILNSYMQKNQEIICDNCGETYELDKLDALKFYDMSCRKCKTGICKVINLSKKYEPILRAINSELLLPQTELGILQTLQIEKKPMFAAEIAAELDRSYQLVGKRGKTLVQRGLLDRKITEQGRPQFAITDLAEDSYFKDDPDNDLRLNENE